MKVPLPRRIVSLRRNTLWNLAGTGLPLLVAAGAVPYLLRHAGVEVFGILTLVWGLIGYFSLFDLGLGRALTQQVAQSLAGGPDRELPSLTKSGLLLAGATGLAGGVLLALLAHPLATDWLKVSPALQEDAFHALLFAALGVPVATFTAGLRGVLEAYEDFRDVNLLRMLLGAATFGLPVLSVVCFGPSLMGMVAALIAARLVIAAAHVVLVHRRLGAGWMQAPVMSGKLRGLLSFGAWMTLSNVISPLMVTADRFFISAALGAAVVAYYIVPSEVITRATILPGALTSALFPRLSSLLMSDRTAARALYRRCVLVLAGLLLPVCLALALGAHWGLSIWLDNEFADRSAPVLSVLALGLFLNGIAFVPFAAVQAAGHARITAQLHMIEILFYLPLLLWALDRFGLVGAAAAWTARVGLDLALLLIAVNRYVLPVGAPAPVRHNFSSTATERDLP